MRTLVAYMSQTGNTEKIARGIFEEISGDKELLPFSEVESTDSFDLLFVGFPIQIGNPVREAKEFLRKCARGKKTALFITHAATEDYPQLAIWLNKCKKIAGKTRMVGLFHCQGELSKEVADLLVISGHPELEDFGRRYGETLGQPDEVRLNRAKAFARKIVQEVVLG